MGYLKKYRPFLFFLAKFFLTYLILGVIYQIYLSEYNESPNQVDPITASVAEESHELLGLFGVDAKISPHQSQPALMMFYNRQYVARIIEGCNALSVMILFAAFVVAFSGTFKHTVLFILLGCVLIHGLNIVRIALLCSAIYHFPQYGTLLHGVVFPLFIYGVVFLLWVLWVNKFSLYAKKPARK